MVECTVWMWVGSTIQSNNRRGTGTIVGKVFGDVDGEHWSVDVVW